MWHFPLIIAGMYKPGTPMWYKLPMFTVEILAITAILTLLRVKSKSVWPAAIFHASHNYFDQSIFEPLTISANRTFFTGETGIITAVVMVLFAIVLFKIYGGLEES